MIFSRAQLEDRLYGWGKEVESNAVDVLIHSVRKKFGAGVIRNVRGLGWTVMLDGAVRQDAG
jgi:DNA-binding response OmpR family regulator